MVRVLHSSWICHDALEPILSRMKASGWSADNVAFGNDGELLQYVTSDDQECHLERSHFLDCPSVVRAVGLLYFIGIASHNIT